MLEIIIIASIAGIFYLLLRKFPQVNNTDLKIRSKSSFFGWGSLKRRTKGFFNSLWFKIVNLLKRDRKAPNFNKNSKEEKRVKNLQ